MDPPAAKAAAGAGGAAILVNPRQKGNPILNSIRNVVWTFDEIVFDYLCGDTTGVVFLSIRFHLRNPDYIRKRLQEVKRQTFRLQVLLVLCDIEGSEEALRTLAKVCVTHKFCLVVAFGNDEAARYLETLKQYEHKSGDELQGRAKDATPLAQLTKAVTALKPLNKTDVTTLATSFRTLKNMANASEMDLSICPGIGPQKLVRLMAAFNTSFRLVDKVKTPASVTEDDGHEPPTKRAFQQAAAVQHVISDDEADDDGVGDGETD